MSGFFFLLTFSSISIPWSSSSTILILSEVLSPLIKTLFFLKIALEKKYIYERGLLDFISYIFVSLAQLKKP